MALGDDPLTRMDIRDIRRALYAGWCIDDATRMKLVKGLLDIAENPQSSDRSVIMATKALVEMHASDRAAAGKVIDKEQPDQHEHIVKSEVRTYQLPDNGRD